MNPLIVIILAASLPTFADFREIDHDRRIRGQLQTPALVKATTIDPALFRSTVQQHPQDLDIVWGAAEFTTDWGKKKTLFESALRLSGTNVPVALRYSCVAAQNADFDVALRWARFCEEKDAANTAPWLVELWTLRQQHAMDSMASLPAKLPSEFRDYGAEAARARIRFLEAAGYSAYSARRLGFNPDASLVLVMARDLSQVAVPESGTALLTTAANSMQDKPTYILTELVGQGIERSLLARRKDALSNEKIGARIAFLNGRKDELRELISGIENNTVDLASERQMTRYFDDVLALGEEGAMKKLAIDVRQPPEGK